MKLGTRILVAAVSAVVVSGCGSSAKSSSQPAKTRTSSATTPAVSNAAMQDALIAGAADQARYFAQNHHYIDGWQALHNYDPRTALVEFDQGTARSFGMGTGSGVPVTATTTGTSWELDMANGKFSATCKDWKQGVHACPTGHWHPNLP